MNGLFVIAHAPLASALRQSVLHVFPDAAPSIVALDVPPNMPPEETLHQAKVLMAQLGAPHVLVFTDLFGATPCNVAQRLVDSPRYRLLAGVNLPMLLRAVTYRHESLDAVSARALAGGTQGIMSVAVTAPQNQNRRTHDPNHHDHQQ